MKYVFDGIPFYARRPDRNRNRLNERHKRIIEANISHVYGKHILDLGSHDGRWQWAAIQAGAEHVTGVEARASSVEAAHKILANLPKEKWKTDCADFFEWLASNKNRAGEFDTIFCLGIFYHLLDHNMFLRLMSDLKPEAIIIDSGLMHSDRLYVEVFPETDDNKLHAIADGSGKGTSLVGMISQGLLAEICDRLGWKISYIPWNREDLKSEEGCEDYLNTGEGKHCRFTCVLTR